MAQLVEFASNHLLLVSGLIGTWLVVMVRSHENDVF